MLRSVAGRTVDEIINPVNDVSNPRCIRSLHQGHILNKQDKDQLMKEIQDEEFIKEARLIRRKLIEEGGLVKIQD